MNKHELRDIQRKLGLRIDEVAEVLGVELFTVQQWASGVWPIPRIAEKFLRSFEIHKKVAEDYRDDTYKFGYRDGRLENTQSAHDDGYTRGYDFGFLQGVLAVTKMMLEEKKI